MRLLVFILLCLLCAHLPLVAANDDDEKTVTCEYSDTNWEPLGTSLYTCEINTQAIDEPGYEIKFEPGQSERVEGFRFIDNKNLKYLPSNIAEVFPNLKGLAGTNSYLSSIDNEDLDGLSKLKYLGLANTDLQVIEKATFSDLIELEELDLSDCDIRVINEGAFIGLSALKTLYIGANKLTALEPQTFNGLTSLTSLSMELNHLEHVDDDLFGSNENLADIWLNGNKIVSMSPKVFESVPKLSYVDLQANPCIDGVFDESNFDELRETLEKECASTSFIKKVADKSKDILGIFKNADTTAAVRDEFNIDGIADESSIVKVVNYFKFKLFGSSDESVEFKNDPATKTVECGVSSVSWRITNSELETCEIPNQIIDAKGFQLTPDNAADMASVKAISFAQNKNIKFLPENIAKIAPNIEAFSARNASLQVLSKKNFAKLKNLRSLNLADNSIKHIDPDAFDDLSALEELDLSGNDLETLDEEVFAKLKNLKVLRIGNNKFHEIPPNLFRNLRNLVNVSLSNQQIESIPENLLSSNVKLQNIWMNSNKIKSINPKMFSKLKDLEYLDVRDNKCIDTFYDESNVPAMKEEILAKCGSGYELAKGVKTEVTKGGDSNKKKNKSKKKKKKEKLPKVSESSVEEKEVTCDYEDVFWPNINKTLRTCVISETIDDENYFLNANIMQFEDFSEVQGIEAISFANNKNAKFLPKNVEEVFPNLIAFSAANSGIESLNPETFKGLKKLKFLNLSNNEIKELNPLVFEELTSLEELQLEDNDIEEIEEEVFIYFKVLRKLRLKGNKLRTIEESWFEEMPELRDISFDISNSIHIDSQMFKKNPKLKYIVMNGDYFDSEMTPIDGSILAELESSEKTDGNSEENSPAGNESEDVETVEISCNIAEDAPEICEIDEDQEISSSHYVIKSSPAHENVIEFVIKNNENVKFLPQNLGKTFPKLEKIFVHDSPLSTINWQTFEHMPNLKSIKLTNTDVKSFDSDTFRDLPQLEELDLSSNRIEVLEEGVFDKLRNLRTLRLGHNQLHFLHPKTFKYLTNLRILSMGDNKLSVLDPTTFKNNVNLEEISMEGNPLQNMNPGMFKRLKKLTTVNFSGTNCIDGTFDASEIEKLQTEIAENCEHLLKPSNKEIYCYFGDEEQPEECIIDEDQVIDEADYKISIDASNIDPLQIKRLKISNNDKIKFLPQNIGEVFPNLQHLEASNISLEELPEDSLKNLENLLTLNLSKNKISKIHPTTFFHLESLEELNLNDNDIEGVDEEIFSQLPRLKKIDLSENKVKTMSTDAFKMSPLLEEITIDEIEGFDADDLDVNDGVSIAIVSKEIHKKPAKGGSNYDEKSEEEEEEKEEKEEEKDEEEKEKEKEKEEEEETVIESSVEEKKTSSEREEVQVSSSSESVEDSGSLEEDTASVETTTTISSEKEVLCELETTEWNFDGATVDIISCVISGQPIEDENFVVKATDHDPQIQGLKIDNNVDVKFLPSNIGELFPNLLTFSARNNSLTHVPQDAFKNMLSLKSLDLSHNSLVHLDPELLSDTPSLEEVNLSRNKIKELPEEIFYNSPQIKHIDLRDNEIEEISLTLFDKLPQLNTLIIDEGNLSPELDATLQENHPHLTVETTLKKTSTTTTTTTTESSSYIHTTAPTVVSRTTAATRRKIISASTPATTARPTTTTTTTTSTVKQIKCDIVFEPSEFLRETVMKCDISSEEIDDPEVSLEDIPNGVQVKALKLDNNKNIKYLPENIAKVMPNLVEVSAKNAAIDAILPGDFEDLRKLETIDLSGNDLRSIEPENFDRLNSLKKLDLSDNEIEFIDEDAFDLPQLTELDIKNNEIYFLHPKLFRKLPNLQSLNIEGNAISHLPDDIFERNPRLRELKHSVKDFELPVYTTTTLSPVRILTTFSRQMPTLRPQTFTTRRYPQPVENFVPKQPREVECEFGNIHWTYSDEDLFTCDLKDAVIDDPNYRIKSSPRNRRIKGLSFVDNRNVKFLPVNIAREFPNLVEISAFNSSIRNIPNGALKNLTRLRNLNLMSSDISSIDPQAFESLPALESLDLSNNNLYDLPAESLRSVPSLKALYVSNNNLRHLDPNIFANLAELRNISLENNKLPVIDRRVFARNPELQNVWLNGNRLNAIDPTTFDGKRSLEYVDLRGNDCIDEFFEAYGVEEIRSRLKSTCKPTELETSPIFSKSSTFRSIEPYVYDTTVKPRPTHTTRKTSRKPFQMSSSGGPQTFLSQPQRPTTTTTPTRKITTTTTEASLREVKCTLGFHDFPDSPTPLYTCFINDQAIEEEGVSIRPTSYNSFVEGLVIDDNNRVKHLPERIGDVFPNLKYLSARNNSINDIARDNFEKLAKLKHLDLSDNNLSVVDRETFGNLPSLEELNLGGNNVPHLFNETFAQVPKLRELDLSRNEIDAIDVGVFGSVPQLEKLSLENNEIADLPEAIFRSNPRLESINLNGNKINALYPETFENLPRLKEVNLDENGCIDGHYKTGSFFALRHDIRRNCLPENYVPSLEIATTTAPIEIESSTMEKSGVDCEFSDTYSTASESYLESCLISKDKEIDDPNEWRIKEVPANRRVKRFVVDDNEDFRKFPRNFAASFPELEELSVTNVPLKSLSPDDFKNLDKLNSIVVSNTSIKEIKPETFAGAPNLAKLILSDNNLRGIDDDSFKGLPKLKTLDLSGNKIPKITSEALKHLPQLNELKLSGNDLHVIDGDIFKRNPKLYQVYLDDNSLKTISPNAFDRLQQLIRVDLSKNDCIDKSFGTSNMHVMRKDIADNCMPYGALKGELAGCKKELVRCRKEALARTNEVRSSGSNDVSLRDSLLKAEAKIRQLNLQVNKLQSSLSSEKDLLGREREKARSLQKQLDKLHECARIDENHNFLIDLSCEFIEDGDGKYTCIARNLKIVTENATVDDVKGDHRPKKGKYDVESLVISNQDVRFLPNDLSKHFPYLKELTVVNSKLANINRTPLENLPHLKKLVLKGNDIQRMNSNSFAAAPQLEHLDLSENNLKRVPADIFEKLPNLRELNLNDNALVSLPHDIIPKANNLRKFTVSRNNLNLIDPRLFPKLRDADVIDFSNNKCVDAKFDANDDDKGINFMAFIGGVNMKCISNDDDDDENGFCTGRRAS